MMPISNASNALYLLSNDRVRFGKRVFTEQDEHTGDHRACMRSTINLSFDGVNYGNKYPDGSFHHSMSTKAAIPQAVLKKDLVKI